MSKKRVIPQEEKNANVLEYMRNISVIPKYTPTSTTVNEWMQFWMQNCTANIRHSTRSSYEAAINNHINRVAKVTDTINKVGSSFVGSFITKYDKDNNSDKDFMRIIDAELGDKNFKSVIPYSKIIRNSLNYKVTAYEYIDKIKHRACILRKL